MRTALALLLVPAIALAAFTFAAPAAAAPLQDVPHSDEPLSDGYPMDETVPLDEAYQTSETVTTVDLAAQAAALTRFSGADRYEVAVGISGEYPVGTPVVYIAKGTDYPDALSAAPAATIQGGPLLLTAPDFIPESVVQELERLKPKKIVVVGGENSVSGEVFAALEGFAPAVRIGGADRYEVSRALVDYAFGEVGAPRVYLATGANFPDALSAGAAAGARGGAVIQVNGTAGSLDEATTALIRKLEPSTVIIAGGPNSVSTGIELSVSELPNVQTMFRLGGADRFEASRNINKEAFPSASSVFLATGSNFPDALAGAALAGRTKAPLYVAPGNCVTELVVDDIKAYAPAKIVILGGPASMSPAVETLTPCVAPLSQPFATYVPVVSGYGPRVHPITGVVTMHNGTDYSTSGIRGMPIRSIAEGTVKAINVSYSTSGQGNSITIAHPGKVESLSMHMGAPTTLAIGTHVTAGQIVGYVGTTGASTGPHLHLEVKVNGSRVDPYLFLKGAPYPRP